MPGRLLLLLRHADTEVGEPGLADAERRLTSIGRNQAAWIGRFLVSSQLVPDIALCSDARRARETLAGLAQVLPSRVESSIDRALYEADAYEMLEHVRLHGGRARRLLVVGHNPSIHDLAATLAKGDARLRAGFAPAALAVFRATSPDWEAFGPGTAELVRFTTPERP